MFKSTPAMGYHPGSPKCPHDFVQLFHLWCKPLSNHIKTILNPIKTLLNLIKPYQNHIKSLLLGTDLGASRLFRNITGVPRPLSRAEPGAQHSIRSIDGRPGMRKCPNPGSIPGASGSGAKPYEFIGFDDLDGPKPYEFRGFGDFYGPKPCEFIGFGDFYGPFLVCFSLNSMTGLRLGYDR